MHAAVNPVALSISRSIDAIILGHIPKVPSKQMERMVTTLRSYFHRTMARHTQTTSLRIGYIGPSLSLFHNKELDEGTGETYNQSGNNSDDDADNVDLA
jgi:hypothetical protein